MKTISPTDLIAFLSLVGLIITGIVTAISPFFQKPALEYYITDITKGVGSPHVETLMINIGNYGIASANHVMGSMNSSHVNFLSATSLPYLGKEFYFNNSIINQMGYGMFTIESLPPSSHTLVSVNVNNTQTDHNQPLMTYLRSDESVGYTSWGTCDSHTCRIFFNYGIIVGFLATTIILLIYLWRITLRSVIQKQPEKT